MICSRLDIFAVPSSDSRAGFPFSGPLRWRMLVPGVCSILGWSVLFQRHTSLALIFMQSLCHSSYYLISFKFSNLPMLLSIMVLDSGSFWGVIF
jgi:hypothetical protein